jgi:hypothetical protein
MPKKLMGHLPKAICVHHLKFQHPNPTHTPSHRFGTITLLGYGGSREAFFFRS